MDEKHTVETVDENLFESWRLLASVPSVEMHDGQDMLRFASGVEYPLCNGILRVNLASGEAGERIGEALDVFRKRSLPALCWVTPTTRPGSLGSILETQGLSRAEEVAGMAVEISALPAVTPVENLEVSSVTNEGGLSSWMDVFCSVYELPRNAREFFASAMTHAGLGPGSLFKHYLFLEEGSPVACSSSYVNGQAAGLYNVGTLPSARGKGIGTVASLKPLEDAGLAGCAIAVLHATKMGFPLYTRLGFERVSTLGAYLLQP